MDNDNPLFAGLGELPPMPDGLWERALSVALDPTTPPVDPGIVPEMDDDPIVPDDDGGIVLYDDIDDAVSAGNDDIQLDDDLDLDDDVEGEVVLDDTGEPLPHHSSDESHSGQDFPDLTLGDDLPDAHSFEPAIDDPGLDSDLDMGGDLY